MDLPEASEHTAMERDALRLLCCMSIKSATRAALCKLLRSASFIEPMQRILFEEIAALGAVDSEQLRQLLPSRLTNRGFPDFDLENLLDAKLVSEIEIAKLFESVLRLIQADELCENPEPEI